MTVRTTANEHHGAQPAAPPAAPMAAGIGGRGEGVESAAPSTLSGSGGLGVRRRRRPWVFALCAALVAAGALGSAFAFTSVNDTQEVLVLAADVPRGETIEASDLAIAQVGLDPALTPVTASREAEVIGTRAAVDLWAGTLLTEQAVTEALVPGEGESLVGISLTAAQMPAEPLFAGDVVRVVATPGDQGEVSSGADDPVTVEAVVVGVTPVMETGETVVDVAVAQGEAAGLAARAATGRVALVLESRER